MPAIRSVHTAVLVITSQDTHVAYDGSLTPPGSCSFSKQGGFAAIYSTWHKWALDGRQHQHNKRLSRDGTECFRPRTVEIMRKERKARKPRSRAQS